MTQSDFLRTPFPEPKDLPDGVPEGASRFFNRELSWLSFNWRVLDEARNPRVPLLERLRFVSISATNLDEFYTVRVAGLRELMREGSTTPSDDGLTPAEQLALINADARRLMGAQQGVWNGLRREMEQEGIVILSRQRLTGAEQEFLHDYFESRVFPVLSPLAIDPAHPFPFIPNTGFSLALELARETDGRQMKALLPIPAQLPRFVPLPGGERFLRLEDLLLMHLSSLFPGYRDVGHCSFRVLRDSDLEVEEEAEDLVREFETALKRRRRGSVIRLKITAGAPDRLRRLI
ncbi:MAG: RNA degradosome polyphosphate kinase, partial [Pseudomonadota bacterium]|nr:RNA degradosome polyphosphate kinase [Pseudomonadota bacterium]